MKALQNIALLLCLLLAATFVVACDDAEPQAPPADANNGDNNNGDNNNGDNNNGEPNNSNNNGGDNNIAQVAGQLLVEGDTARSCEVMLRDVARHVGGVVFGEGVEGRGLRRGDMLAVAFFTQEDTTFSIDAVGLRAADLEGVEVASGRCFDAKGAQVDAPTFTIER